MCSLTDLMKKSEKFDWQVEYQEAFDIIKNHFMSGPVLRHFNPEFKCVIVCDASNFAISAILLLDVDGRFHQVAFHSRKMNMHEINYAIRDEEFLAITSVVKEWRQYLGGTRHKINVYTDHKGLKWFAKNNPLNHRKAWWALELDGVEFQIIPVPGSKMSYQML